ncbi:MAG: subunit of tubulin prefoldin [Phylliscum demangeonii]|nr:MAG: subunit of tubulin prefoldin [Phylliscum demangeonii]
MASATQPTAQPAGVDISTLTAAQLGGLKKQLDDELEQLTTSFGRLRAAQVKFRECIGSMKDGLVPYMAPGPAAAAAKSAKTAAGGDTIVPANDKHPKPKEVLIPLTTSLYVPAQLASPETVIVDVGTGYYVEKTTPDAIAFYGTKIGELAVNLKSLEGMVQDKSNTLRVVEDILRQKMLSESQNAAAAAAAAAAPASAATSVAVSAAS